MYYFTLLVEKMQKLMIFMFAIDRCTIFCFYFKICNQTNTQKVTSTKWREALLSSLVNVTSLLDLTLDPSEREPLGCFNGDVSTGES